MNFYLFSRPTFVSVQIMTWPWLTLDSQREFSVIRKSGRIMEPLDSVPRSRFTMSLCLRPRMCGPLGQPFTHCKSKTKKGLLYLCYNFNFNFIFNAYFYFCLQFDRIVSLWWINWAGGPTEHYTVQVAGSGRTVSRRQGLPLQNTDSKPEVSWHRVLTTSH